MQAKRTALALELSRQGKADRKTAGQQANRRIPRSRNARDGPLGKSPRRTSNRTAPFVRAMRLWLPEPNPPRGFIRWLIWRRCEIVLPRLVHSAIEQAHFTRPQVMRPYSSVPMGNRAPQKHIGQCNFRSIQTPSPIIQVLNRPPITTRQV